MITFELLGFLNASTVELRLFSLCLSYVSFLSWLTERIWIWFPHLSANTFRVLPLDETPDLRYTWAPPLHTNPTSYIQGDRSSTPQILLCYLERRYQVPSAKGSILKEYLLPSLRTLASHQTTSGPPSHILVPLVIYPTSVHTLSAF